MCRYMRLPIAFRDNQQISLADSTLLKQLERGAHNLSKPIASMLGGGKAPRLSEVHCNRDSVCVKTDT